MPKSKLARRDRCYLVGKRASQLTSEEAAKAWNILSSKLSEELGNTDVPKFNRLLSVIRQATIESKRH